MKNLLKAIKGLFKKELKAEQQIEKLIKEQNERIDLVTKNLNNLNRKLGLNY